MQLIGLSNAKKKNFVGPDIFVSAFWTIWGNNTKRIVRLGLKTKPTSALVSIRQTVKEYEKLLTVGNSMLAV